jgi:hypothetical protein
MLPKSSSHVFVMRILFAIPAGNAMAKLADFAYLCRTKQMTI